MIETRIPKDIRVYETKIGGLTLRKAVCIFIAGVVDVLVCGLILVPMEMPPNAYVYVVVFLDVPILAFTVKVRGMKMEQFLAVIIRDNILPPKKRVAQNTIVETKRVMPTDKQKKNAKKKERAAGRKNPEFQAYR